MNFADHPNLRWLLFLGWLVCSIAISWTAFATLLRYSFGNDDASHILLIPFICAWLMFIDRGRIFKNLSSDVTVCLVLLVPGVAIILSSIRSQPPSPSLCAFGLVLVWIAGFALAFGREALKTAQFPLMFLFLFHSTPRSAPQQRGVFSSEGFDGNIGTIVWTDTPAQFCERVSYSIYRASVLKWPGNAAASAPALLCWF